MGRGSRSGGERRIRRGGLRGGRSGPWIVRSALLLLLVPGCGPTEELREAAERAERTGFRGVVLERPPPPADFTLTDTEGASYRLSSETRGYFTLLFFGYTHCPDVCPVQMANLAAVLDDLPHAERRRFKVVFVTTDPDRDTPERLRAWLDRFDRDFIGLRGDLETVNEIQRRLGLPAAALLKEPADAGDYLVGHASQVVALSPDGRPRVAYPFGTRQMDWSHDLPLLARTWLPSEAFPSTGEPFDGARTGGGEPDEG